ncbi:MAG TPA: hypothetical protein VN802_20830 [Stellaceae bacterium]|nr:hypothetical protein [Stellaceae bacterium]
MPWQRRHTKTRDRTVGGIAGAFLVIALALAFAFSQNDGFNAMMSAMWARF